MTAVHKPRDLSETLSSDLGIFAEEDLREELEQQRKLQEKKLDNALASVLQTDSGRTVIKWIFDLTGVDETCTDANAMRMMALSARRDVGLQIKARLKAAGLSIEEENNDN